MPIEAVRTVALDPASEAAATLVRVLLSGDAPRRTFVEVPPGTDPAAASADAWLEIGDAALRRALSADAPPSFNPSREWAKRTGLPFAFAVWIVRAGVELSREHLESFARARARGAARVPALAEEASRTWNLPLADCRRYLEKECRYDPGEKLPRALLAFRDAAAELGLCERALAPEPIALPAAHVA
jgi:chorismate dehydratase